MPVKRTTKGGRPAFKWGTTGKAYTYTPGNKKSRQAARARAERQGRAIEASKQA